MGFHSNGGQQWPQDADRTTSPSELDDTGASPSTPPTSRPRKRPFTLCCAGAGEGAWENEQHVLATPLSVAVAPPPGSASLRLNSLQQRSTLLANREWQPCFRLSKCSLHEQGNRLFCDCIYSGLSDLPFMVMPHPLIPVGLPPAGVAMAMNRMSQLSGLANMAAMSQAQEEESKVSASVTPALSPEMFLRWSPWSPHPDQWNRVETGLSHPGYEF